MKIYQEVGFRDISVGWHMINYSFLDIVERCFLSKMWSLLIDEHVVRFTRDLTLHKKLHGILFSHYRLHVLQIVIRYCMIISYRVTAYWKIIWCIN